MLHCIFTKLIHGLSNTDERKAVFVLDSGAAELILKHTEMGLKAFVRIKGKKRENDIPF